MPTEWANPRYVNLKDDEDDDNNKELKERQSKKAREREREQQVEWQQVVYEWILNIAIVFSHTHTQAVR